MSSAGIVGREGPSGEGQERFAAGTNPRSERNWRMTNELPFIAAIVMVLSVTLEWTF